MIFVWVRADILKARILAKFCHFKLAITKLNKI